jgi:hypothetical protein
MRAPIRQNRRMAKSAVEMKASSWWVVHIDTDAPAMWTDSPARRPERAAAPSPSVPRHWVHQPAEERPSLFLQRAKHSKRAAADRRAIGK